MRARFTMRVVWGAFVLLALGATISSRLISSETPPHLDPAGWGTDHVGRPVPEFTTGEQCLFCHRNTVGPTWTANRHHRTIREFADENAIRAALRNSPAEKIFNEIQYVMGDRQRQRLLKSAAAYGKADLLSVQWAPPHNDEAGALIDVDNPHWDVREFGESCAGCHATAVDPKTTAFVSISLDCCVCHGDLPAEHANRRELAILSPARKDEARVVTSICAQCHVRTGKSKNTGRPYPTNFVAGDNLFRDFVVDFSDEALVKLSAADRHVLENVRDVAVWGKETVTCLSCHDIHRRSIQKHESVAETGYCVICHDAGKPKHELKPFTVHSRTCQY